MYSEVGIELVDFTVFWETIYLISSKLNSVAVIKIKLSELDKCIAKLAQNSTSKQAMWQFG